MLCGLLCVLARDTRCCVGSCVCWLETHDVVCAPVCAGWRHMMVCVLLCVLARDTRCCVGSCVCWLATHDVVWAPVCVG